MSSRCHLLAAKVKSRAEHLVALAGNPNVGKSSIFNQLTGLGVTTANYPGKTVELNFGTVVVNGTEVSIVDLPGTYALGGVSEDQWVARQAVLELRPEAVVVIVDATNLERNLYMVLQFMDLGFPVVVALNLTDEAEKRGIQIDAEMLSAILAVPVVKTVATQGVGLKELMNVVLAQIRRGGQSETEPRVYSDRIRSVIESLTKRISEAGIEPPYGLSPRAYAVLLMEGDPEFLADLEQRDRLGKIRELLEQTSAAFEHEGTSLYVAMAAERYRLAGEITRKVQRQGKGDQIRFDKAWRLTTSPKTGLPILLAVAGCIFATLFYVGGWLSRGLEFLWNISASKAIQWLLSISLGENMAKKILLWGFDAGILAVLTVGIPYVLVFYFILALLEDSGYLNSVAFLLDRVMHRMGLHGRAVIPMIAGAGCSVPAIIGTRVLSSKRERTLAAALITMIPCSARTSVIMGAVSLFVGWQWAAVLFLLVMLVILAAGVFLNAVMPGQSHGLVMEMFPFRVPLLKNVAKKTWHRFKDFAIVASPIVLGGSLAMGVLYETGLIWQIEPWLKPVLETWLGLPSVAGLTLVFAVLRKELALELLVALAVARWGNRASTLLYFMTKQQIFVYAFINTIYIPCVATFAVLGRELGWKRAVLISLFTIAVALLLGGTLNFLIKWTGVMG